MYKASHQTELTKMVLLHLCRQLYMSLYQEQLVQSITSKPFNFNGLNMYNVTGSLM